MFSTPILLFASSSEQIKLPFSFALIIAVSKHVKNLIFLPIGSVSWGPYPLIRHTAYRFRIGVVCLTTEVPR